VPAARLLRTRLTFSRSVMVSLGVSALGRTSIHFVEPGVDLSCRNTLLLQGLLPEIRKLSEYFIFSARQCAGTSVSGDSRVTESRDIRLHSVYNLATEQSGLESR